MNLFPLMLLAIPVAQSEWRPAPVSVSISADQQRDITPSMPNQLAQTTIEQRVIIRVPMVRRSMPVLPPESSTENEQHADSAPMHWIERKGPKCVKVKKILAAAITSKRGVDLLLRGDYRIRARLGRGCRSADLYSGFYIQPNVDGELCADRDRVLARSGADCEITSLLRLVPER